jgi:organic radical activating enzyme
MSYFDERRRQQEVSIKRKEAPFPKNCLVEVTNSCNHACVFCHNPFMHRKAGLLDKVIYERFITEAVSLGMTEVGLYSTGEPFVAKNLAWYVDCSRRAGIKRIYVTTNGALASLERVQECVDKGLSSIKFSINAGSRESYRLTHGADDFEAVLNNVRAIHRWKVEEAIDLQMLGSFIFTKATQAEIDMHRSIFSKYLEDIIYIEAQSQGGRTEGNISGIVEPLQHPDLSEVKPCDMLWNRLHLTCEGFLTACCVDYEHDLTYADYRSGMPLDELWNGEAMQALRNRHLERRLDGLICKNCLAGGREPYNPISGLRGQFRKKGAFEDETSKRIREVERRLGHEMGD